MPSPEDSARVRPQGLLDRDVSGAASAELTRPRPVLPTLRAVLHVKGSCEPWEAPGLLLMQAGLCLLFKPQHATVVCIGRNIIRRRIWW